MPWIKKKKILKMSMLAEPRRKQKNFNLRAKNSAWSNDSEKFGQKMLEKMGWSAGKGLGAKENGIVEHVLARYKNDSAGLGFEDRNDQWTKNEQDFEGLLKSLSGGNESSNNEIHQATSLEEKSKKSLARVHYHKFTRGKDVSKYSAKDLANILGKKTLNDKPILAKFEVIAPKEEYSSVTGQLFTSKGTMSDYFNKFKTNSGSNLIENFQGDVYNNQYAGFGLKDNTDKIKINGCNSNETEKISKKMKRKRNSTNEVIDRAHHSSSEDLTFRGNFLQGSKDQVPENIEEPVQKKKKKNKKKMSSASCLNESSAVVSHMNTQIDNVSAVGTSEKKSKKKKGEISPIFVHDCGINVSNTPKSKKKKRKTKENHNLNKSKKKNVAYNS